MLFQRLKNKLPLILILLLSPIILVFNILLILIMCLDPRTRKFDKEEARLLLADELEKVRNLGYTQLRKVFVEQKGIQAFKVTGASGVEYQIEIEGWWDGDDEADIRILGGIDNGGLRAYVPLSDLFIVRPDEPLQGALRL